MDVFAVITKLAAPPASGIVYVCEAAGAGEVIVVVFVVPKTNWLVVGLIVTADENVVAPAIVCVPAVITKLAAPPASGIVYVRDAAGAGEVIVVVFVMPNTN